MNLANIMTQIATIQKSIKGINRAFDKAPEDINDPPCFVNYVETFDIDNMASWIEIHWVIKMLLFVGRAELPEAINKVQTLFPLVISKFNTELRLNESCNRSQLSNGTISGLKYGDTPYWGATFDLHVWETEGFEYKA